MFLSCTEDGRSFTVSLTNRQVSNGLASRRAAAFLPTVRTLRALEPSRSVRWWASMLSIAAASHYTCSHKAKCPRTRGAPSRVGGYLSKASERIEQA